MKKGITDKGLCRIAQSMHDEDRKYVTDEGYGVDLVNEITWMVYESLNSLYWKQVYDVVADHVEKHEGSADMEALSLELEEKFDSKVATDWRVTFFHQGKKDVWVYWDALAEEFLGDYVQRDVP